MYFKQKNIIAAVIVLIALLGVTLIIFSNKATTSLLPFSNCPLPCVLDIFPGETTYTEAVRIIEASVPEEQILLEANYFWIQANDLRVYVTLHPTDVRRGDFVRSVELSTWMEGGEITLLQQILNAGYVPHRVFRDSRTVSAMRLLITFGEYDELIAQLLPTERVDGNSSVHTLTIASQQDADTVLADLLVQAHYEEEVDWLGFAPTSTYLQAQEK